MKVGILAGGLGTRLSEETEARPKPMVEIGGRPMLWHIMDVFARHGLTEFAIALGYKGEVIKDYFTSYRTRQRSLTVRLGDGSITCHDGESEDWIVHLLDTGATTQTGGRVKRLGQFIGPETFILTYGDGLADIDVQRLIKFHRAHGRLATVTAVRPPARFGGIQFSGDFVSEFIEKPQIGEGWINGGFFVFEPEVLDYISGDETLLEHEQLERLAQAGELVAYRHDSFWQCMDTLRDVRLLESLCAAGNPPWQALP